MSRSRWQHRVVERDGVRLAARVAGEGDLTVVLLTGLGSSQRAWERVAARLQVRSPGRHRLVTVDHRGHARSSAASSCSFEDLLADVHAVLEELAVRDPVLCGWSMGADLAVWYAAEHPGAAAGVVAVDGGIPADPVDVDPDVVRRHLSRPSARLLQRVARALGEGVHLDTEQVLSLVAELDRRRADVLRAHERLQAPPRTPVAVALASRPPRAPDAERLRETWVTGARRLTTACPDVELRWLDSDHAVPLRRPDEVADLVEATAARVHGR